MADLTGWLVGIREKSTDIGEIAFRQTERKRDEWRRISENDPVLSNASFNSALERVFDEQDDFDPLHNQTIVVEFQPLYEAMHIYDCLNKADEFRDTYSADRRKQMDLLLPSSINLDDDGQYLRDLLANITGFAILERATASKTQNFRSVSEIEGLWDFMCMRVIDLITEAVANIKEPRVLLSVKSSVMLFMQTIQFFRDTTSL
jgi:hypothetical protein